MPAVLSSTAFKIFSIIKLEFFQTDFSFLVKTYLFKSTAKLGKNHFSSQLKTLSCISGIDCLDNPVRFCLVYEFLSIRYNFRMRVKVLVDELAPMSSIETVMPGAYWWECEVWDMFGIYFLGETVPVRLLTDYGFHGHPLRKNFPLTNYVESAYSLIKSKVIYEKSELAQEYRTFSFLSPWETFSKT